MPFFITRHCLVSVERESHPGPAQDSEIEPEKQGDEQDAEGEAE
jgi:hypothetical protein